MRAVNLLPEKHRPRRPTGGKSGSSYVLLGALGAIVVGVLLYVLTVNSINSSKTSIADAKAEAQRANAQADALGAYGDFAKVKAQREESVKQLAQQRVDWERLVRELAHVLPNGVWIASAQASDGSGDPAAGAASASPDASTGQPSLTLTGCAESQREVADTLVRLREVQGATDVKLDHSSRGEDASSGSSAPTSSAAATTGDCGTTHGKSNYDFAVDVALKPDTPGDTAGNVPARLGGGQ
jgi:Tfp pilus assembly protein PilN